MIDIALVLDGHSRAALETVQSLGRLGIRTHIAAESADILAFASRYPVLRLQQPPPLPSSSFVDWLRAVDDEHSYRLIVPTTETSLKVLVTLAEGEPLREKAVVPSNASLEVALDKDRTLSLAKELGIPVPSSRIISPGFHHSAGVEYPTVLKPVSSKVAIDGRLTTLAPAIIRDNETRTEHLDRWLPYTRVLEQAYVKGRGVGIEMLYDRGELMWHFAHERLHESPLTGGGSTYRKAIRPPRGMLEASKTLLDALSWHGVAMVEYKLSADGSFALMEINPRLWGSLALAIDAGVDFPRGLWALATGGPLAAQQDYRIGYTTRSVTADARWMQTNLLASHGDPLLLTRPRPMSFVEWMKPLIRTESWDHWDWHDLGVTRHMFQTDFKRYWGAVRRRLGRRAMIRRIRRSHASMLQNVSTAPPRRNILIMCYGNICRSPFAELRAAQRLRDHSWSSGGFHSVTRRSSPTDLQEVASEMGVDLSGWRSGGIDRETVESSDLILLMDLKNYEQMARLFPDALERTTMLGLFHPSPTLTISDPYGKDKAEIRTVLTQIGEAVDGLGSWLARLENAPGSA